MSDVDYLRLASLRAGLRAYLAWAEDEARACGTTPMQFQLALAIQAATEQEVAPTVGDLAGALLLKHHSVVGLVDRAEAAGLVQRSRDDVNGALVRVALTAEGTELLETLATRHQRHLQEVGPQVAEAWAAFAAGAVGDAGS